MGGNPIMVDEASFHIAKRQNMWGEVSTTVLSGWRSDEVENP